MPDLSTTYLGLQLKNPLVASPSPLSKRVDLARKLEEHGAAAIVMSSLFEEQIRHESEWLDYQLEHRSEQFAEAITYHPEMHGSYGSGPEPYLDHIASLKAAVQIPVIASLNGTTLGGWVDYAQKMEEAGADALELNIYALPTDTTTTSPTLEGTYVQLVREVRARITIPLAVKLSPFFTSIPNICARLAEAGANGLVLFNRFYQPDFDLDALEVVSNLRLSDSDDLRLPLRWIAMLYGHVDADFALTSGVHSGTDALKAVMAGASIAMTTSELLKNGIPRLGEMLAEMNDWLAERDYESLAIARGSMSQRGVGDATAFERANYIGVLSSFDDKLP
jgi:dihydroorotate dehydrogenase (fumarate)